MATKRISRFCRSLGPTVPVLAILLGLALTTGCACTHPDCQFGITAPKNGATLSPGDVDVNLNPLMRHGLCGFPAHAYEVRMDGGASQRVPRGDAPSAHFSGVGPGSHTAYARAFDSLGRPLADAQVTFLVEAPPPPPPPPAPPVVEAPPAAVPPPPPPPAPEESLEQLSGYLKDVFFDVNRSAIRPDQRDALKADAEWLKAHETVKVSIEGHCDERGNQKYNLALGERRVAAVKEALIGLGVDASRLTTTISYGEDHPFAQGHDEEAWSKNRRVHFVVTAK